MKKEFRLLKNNEFSNVITKGKKYTSTVVNVFVINNDLNKIRVGISTPTKIGHAVTRNKVRRQIRTILDLYLNYKLYSLDIVLIAKNKFVESSFKEIQSIIESIIKQIGILNEKEN